MNYQSSSVGGEGSWNENIWKDQKVEISLKIQMIFLAFVDLRIVQKRE